LDDCLILNSTRQGLSMHVALIVELLQGLGFVINTK
jgi:hypothetical protein